MFQWDKSINAINIPVSKIVHLFRSMREVQLALPGVPAQQAAAFLCQYQATNGIATAVVFHLHKSHVLAFYFSEPRIVPAQKIDSMLDQGLNFVESMGFLMTDQDMQLLNQADQEMLWESLPLMSGLQQEEVQEKPAAAASKKAADKPVASGAATGTAPAPQTPPTPTPTPVAVSSPVKAAMPATPPVEVAAKAKVPLETPDNVNDLLAAVDAMRAKRPGLRARRTPPSTEEMERRRLQLRETVGRILASL